MKIIIFWILMVVNLYAQSFYAMVDLNNNYLLGGVLDGEFIDPEQASNHITGGENYMLYSINGKLGKGTGGLAEPFGEPCEDLRVVHISTDTLNYKMGYPTIALGSKHEAFPKVFKMHNTKQKNYLDITKALLEAEGIKNPTVILTKVLRTDIENDGIEEVIISATYLSDGLLMFSEPGDYSIVYIRKIIAGKVENIFIEKDLLPWGEYRRPAIPMNYEHQISAVLDINGDGILEIILHGEYYEGSFVTVYTFQNSKILKIMENGCGS